MLSLDHNGISVTIRLDYFTFSILGLSEFPLAVRNYLGSWRDAGPFKHHYHSSTGPGYKARWGAKEKCLNWPLELELSGEFFSMGKDLDFVLNSIYSSGGLIRPSRIDLCTDYFGPLDPFCLESIRGQKPKGNDYWDEDKWLGFQRGDLPGRVYEIYDKAHEQVVERRKKLPPGVVDWFRYEFRMGSDYLKPFFDEAFNNLFSHDFTWLMIGWSGDQTSFRCGFFSDLHRDLRHGRIPAKETVTLTFDAAFDVLARDVFSKINNFRKRFSFMGEVSNADLFGALIERIAANPSNDMGTSA